MDRAQNDLYLHLVEHLPDGIAIHVDGVVVFANRAAAGMMGVATTGEMVGRRVADFVHPDDRAAVAERIRGILRGEGVGEPRDERFVRADGSVIDVEVRAMPVEIDGRTGVQVIVRDVTRSRSDRRALESSERKLRAIFDASTEAIAINSAVDGRYLDVNPRWESLSGYSRDEVVGRTVRELGTWADDDARRDLVRRVSAGPVIDAETEFRTKNGATIWVLFSAIRLDLEGTPCVLTFCRDISERKHAAQALERYAEDLARSRLQLADAQAVARVGSWEIDVEWKKIDWSDETFRLFGLVPVDPAPSIDEALEYIDPDDRPSVTAYLDELRATGGPAECEFRVRPASGGEVTLVARARRFEGKHGSPARLVGTVQDVTERKAAEQALRESDERFRQLAENTSELFWIAAPDLSRYFYLSPAFKSVWGLTEEAVNRNPRAFYEYVPPEGRALVAESIRLLKAGKPVELDLRIVQEGRERWLWIRGFPIFDAAGRAHRIAGLTVDVTERKLLEAELRRARDAALDADRLKTAFLANMSHEIRTPLNVIMGLTSFVGDHLAAIGDHSQDECFEGIARASKRLLATINGIVDLSRFQAKGFEVRPTAVDLPALLRRHLREFEPIAAQKGIRVEAHVETRAVVRFDEYCLSQAIGHILDNAFKFTERGEVSLRLRRLEDGTLSLEVSDTGVGIDPAFLPRLFHSFTQEEAGYTRRFEGSGLGLALVRRYLEMNGASIAVESQKGRGSTFRIRFPAYLSLMGAAPAEARPAAEAPKPAGSAREAGSDKPLVLVVEDDPMTQLFMKAMLERHCTVLPATSGNECRAQLREHPGAVSLVLMDLSLRGNEDGLVLARAIRNDPATAQIPIIAVTAHAFEKDRRNALEAGCDDYLVKPVPASVLLAKMSSLLRRDTSERRELAK